MKKDFFLDFLWLYFFFQNERTKILILNETWTLCKQVLGRSDTRGKGTRLPVDPDCFWIVQNTESLWAFSGTPLGYISDQPPTVQAQTSCYTYPRMRQSTEPAHHCAIYSIAFFFPLNYGEF